MHPPVETDDLEHALDRAAALLRRAERVAVLTGAGVSAESGVATFRGAGGLWEGHSVEEVATPMAFRRDPALVWRFYHARRAALRAVGPNPGHLALVALEDSWGSDRFTLITQNVDGLHRAAGSRHVVEVHGTLARVRCTGCDKSEDTTADLPELPKCGACGALLRPAVVWFHEMLPEAEWAAAVQAAAACQAFLVVGTSAIVYPAAGLIDTARAAGAGVIEVNIEPTAAAGRGAVRLRGPSGVLLPRLAERLG
jgi:NAD-dependent deacetylase